jgi:AbrB family looped-hinge helix DNA binding protein
MAASKAIVTTPTVPGNGAIGMTHRVGRKGQVVIPKAFREAVSLAPGDEVTSSREGNAIRVERVVSPDALMGRLAGYRLVDALERDRQTERRR